MHQREKNDNHTQWIDHHLIVNQVLSDMRIFLSKYYLFIDPGNEYIFLLSSLVLLLDIINPKPSMLGQTHNTIMCCWTKPRTVLVHVWQRTGLNEETMSLKCMNLSGHKVCQHVLFYPLLLKKWFCFSQQCLILPCKCFSCQQVTHQCAVFLVQR